MRARLAELQRLYREKQRQLARLSGGRKSRDTSTEESPAASSSGNKTKQMYVGAIYCLISNKYRLT